MRTAKLLISLLLLLLVTRVLGIRLEEESRAALQNDIHEKVRLEGEGSVDERKASCGFDEHCSGKSRKLIAKTSSKSKIEKRDEMTVDAKGEQTVVSREGLHAAAPPARKQPQTYPDILDIAGMDYSPATRKPPIHN